MINILEKLISLKERLILFKNLFLFINLQNNSNKNNDISFVSVGPGDPSMITLSALSCIYDATLIAYPISYDGGESMAARIVSKLVKINRKALPIIMPMVKDKDILRKAWRIATDKIAEAAFNGEKIAFICEGDISIYSTASYLFIDLKQRYPELKAVLISGVSSISAASALSRMPLAMQNEQLLVLPTPETSEDLICILKEAIKKNRIIVFLKLGSRWRWIRPELEKLDLLKNSIFAQRVGWPDQNVIAANLVEESEKPYFSLLIVRQNWPEILPEKY